MDVDAIRLEVFRELVQRYDRPEPDWLVAQTLRISHVIEHGTEQPEVARDRA
jgi:hypothetical protein